MREDPEGPALRQARRTRSWGFTTLGLAAVALASPLLLACSPGYVLRAGYEEAKVLWRREPIADVLGRDDLAADVRRKLDTVLAARAFAVELGLKPGGSFTSLSYVDGDENIFVVSAAPRTALEPYTWWFPIVGRLPYKGFFDRAGASAEAERLASSGYDTHVRTAAAFSTLGWFDDPLFRHLLREDEGVLVNLVLHEVFHNTFYLRGRKAAAFNESLASFAGYRGAIAFFAARSEQDLREGAEAAWEDERRFADFIQALGGRLRKVYAAPTDEGAKLAERERVFAAARAELRELRFKERRYTRMLDGALNNAVVLQHLTYTTGFDLFEEAYRRHSDLRATLEFVQRASRGGGDDSFDALRRALGDFAPGVAYPREPPQAHNADGSGR